jgi:hypothetical protein
LSRRNAHATAMSPAAIHVEDHNAIGARASSRRTPRVSGSGSTSCPAPYRPTREPSSSSDAPRRPIRQIRRRLTDSGARSHARAGLHPLAPPPLTDH